MSAPLEQGETYQYRQTVVDSSGNPADAGALPGGVVATITLPDGSTTAPTVTKTGTGQYDFDYTTSQVGRHTLLVSATGGTLASAVEKFDDVFHVEPPGRFLVGFDDARTHLRATTTITTLADREQLRWLCLVASDAIERDLDRIIARRSVTETYDGGKTGIQLRSGPVISITTVVESGVTLSGSDYLLDSNSTILWRGTTTSIGYWADGRQNVTVTSVVGEINPPAASRAVALYVIQSLWQSSQQAPNPFIDEAGAAEAGLLAPSLLAGLPQPLRNAYASLDRRR